MHLSLYLLVLAIQEEHDAADLSRRAAAAEGARARLMALEGSVLRRGGTQGGGDGGEFYQNSSKASERGGGGRLKAPEHKRQIGEWLQKAIALGSQEHELVAMIDAEMARRAALAAELRELREEADAQRHRRERAASADILAGASDEEEEASIEGEQALEEELVRCPKGPSVSPISTLSLSPLYFYPFSFSSSPIYSSHPPSSFP